MAAMSNLDVINRIKSIREVDLKSSQVENLSEWLKQITKFLQEHETQSSADTTHCVFEQFSDWWMGTGKKGTFKLAIAEDNTVTILRRHMAFLYNIGIPMTLTERRTQQTHFSQDIEIWGKPDSTIQAQELFDEQNGFTRMLGQVMGSFYRSHLAEMLQQEKETVEKGKIQEKDQQGMYLDMVVFDSTGTSKTKGVEKTSARIVWPGIIVERDKALEIQNYFAWKFTNSTEEDVKALLQRAKDLNPDNTPQKIFSDCIYAGSNALGVRMPLNDRVSPPPMKVPEKRPLRPFCVVRFHYQQVGDQNLVEVAPERGVEIIASHDDPELTGEHWLHLGALRCDLGSLVTNSDMPLDAGNVQPAPRTRASPGPANAAEMRTGGRATVRTAGGSSDCPNNRRPQNGNRDTQEKTSTTTIKVYEGSKEEFRRLLETKFEGGTYEDGDQGKLIYTAKNGEAKIEFNPLNGRVYYIGKASHVRSMVVSTVAFTQSCESRSVAGASTVRGSQRAPGSMAGSMAGGYYAVSHASHARSTPGTAYAPSSASRAGAMSTGSIIKEDSKKRIANQNFQAESEGELSLAIGDPVTVISDSDGATDAHRWVYGTNERTNEKGWFAHSYTSAVPNQD